MWIPVVISVCMMTQTGDTECDTPVIEKDPITIQAPAHDTEVQCQWAARFRALRWAMLPPISPLVSIYVECEEEGRPA